MSGVTVTYVRPASRWTDDHRVTNCCLNLHLFLHYQHYDNAAAAAAAEIENEARLLSLTVADQQWPLHVLLTLRNSSDHSSSTH